jgi:Flp pilus assembly protein TadB
LKQFDLDQLGTLWREMPDEGEDERLRRSAWAANRRAQFQVVFDQALLAVLIAAIVTAIILFPQLAVIAVGAALAVLLVWGQIRQRRFLQAEWQRLDGDTLSMIEQALVSNEVALKRAAFGLVFVTPATLLGVLLAFFLESGGAELSLPIVKTGWSRLLVTTAAAVAFVLLIAHLLHTVRRRRRELRRLEQLRESFLADPDVSRADGA